MDLRHKLTLLFVGLVALIMALSSLAIYYFSADYRKEDFYTRLHYKGQTAARLLLEVEEVDVNLLRKIQGSSPTSLYSEKLVIYNYLDEVLFTTDTHGVVQPKPVQLDRIRLEGEQRWKQSGHEVIGFLFVDTYDRFVVVSAAQDYYGWRKLRNLRVVLALTFAGGVIAATLLGWFFAGKALKPITHVLEEVGRIGAHSLDTRLKAPDNKDEIGRLVLTFNSFLERLEKAFGIQKNFIANASHEMRTPLTIISGQLEVLLMQERSAEEYKQTLHSVYDDIKNLNTTSNRLLLLTLAHSEVARNDMRSERIDEIAWQSRSEVLRRNEAYRIEVSIDERMDTEEQLSIWGNAQLLKTAMTNLLDNACKYSSDHHARLHITEEQGALLLQVIDRGIGIPLDEQEAVFEPFHRASNARSFRGRGIGLSLVARITELHRGHIALHSIPSEGSTFTMRLPRS